MKKKIQLGTSNYAGEYLVPMMLSDWHRDGNSELKVEISDSERIFEQVLSGDLEVGLIGICFEHDDLETKEFLINDELILAIPNKHPLAEKETLQTDDLKGQNFIIREPGSATRMWMRESLARVGLMLDDFNIVAEFDAHRAILSAVESNAGLAFLPKYIASNSLKQGKIRTASIENLSPITGSLCIIHNRRFLSPDGEELLAFLEQERNKIQECVRAA